MSDREHTPDILEHSSGHPSVEGKSGSPEVSPVPDGDVEERQSHSRSHSRSRSHSFSRRRRSYSRSRENENDEEVENENKRSHSRGRRYRHYGSRSRSRSPRHHKYSRSRSRSYSPRRSYSPQYRDSYYGDEKYYGRYGGGKGKYSSRRSPMSSRRRNGGNRYNSTSQGRSREDREAQRENPEPSRCLGVFGLSLYTQERELREVFGKYGPIEDVQVVYDAQSGRSRGFAFVYFEETDDAKMAKERCNGTDIDGRKIRVDYSITKRAHTPTPGIYMGKPTYPRFGGREGGSGGGGSGGSSYYRDRHSPSPYYRHRYSRSRSRSYSPRHFLE